MTSRGDTIAAVATAPGRAGVAVVRVSGPDAFKIARALTGKDAVPGRVSFVSLKDAKRPYSALIDQGLLLAFKAPHSYTGEDVVEFQTHGGGVTPRRVLEAAISAGARLARRGEFTERAFLNGKLSLDEAESVLDLIDAKTNRAADAALSGLAGERTREARAIYGEIVSLASAVEHALDVDEDDLSQDFYSSLDSRLSSLVSRLDRAIAHLREGELLRDGALVVIAGEPNAGKSSLLNALVGESRAIVSDVPGTTRDSIEAWLDIGGFPVRLVDTAGLRETGDAIEAEGVRRSEALVAKADLVIMLDPAAEPTARILPIQPKADLTINDANTTALRVSSKTGEGLEALREEIAKRLTSIGDLAPGGLARDDDASSMSKRLLSTYLSMRAAMPTGDGSRDLVLFGNALRRAAAPLGELLGATYSEDLLEAVFSRFCVGK